MPPKAATTPREARHKKRQLGKLASELQAVNLGENVPPRRPHKRRISSDDDNDDGACVNLSIIALQEQKRTRITSPAPKDEQNATQAAMPETVKTTFLLISDTHSNAPQKSTASSVQFRKPFPQADVLIHAGDLTNSGSIKSLRKTIDWIADAPAEVKIIVAGNHDRKLDEKDFVELVLKNNCDGEGMNPSEMKVLAKKESKESRGFLKSEELHRKGIYYLENEIKRFDLSNGAKFTVLASPCTPRGPPPHYSGAFRYSPHEEKDFWEKKFPKCELPSQGIDIAVVHGPARGMLDNTSDGHNVGCEQLLGFMTDLKPLLSVCGHIHEAAGAKLVAWAKLSPNRERTRYTEEVLETTSYKVSDAAGSLYYDIRPETGDIVKDKRTLFVNASIVGPGGSSVPERPPILVELDLPCSDPDATVYEGSGQQDLGVIIA